MLMESLHQRLGLQAMVDDLIDLDAEDMLQYNPYEGESQNVETFSILDEEQKVEILLPRGDKMVRW